jgi:hypothetical protein
MAEGRVFDTLGNQIAKNGDDRRRLIVKMDVEGAEWDSFLFASDSVLANIDQLVVEFHHAHEERFLAAVQRLTHLFYVAHLHFNNFSCDPTLTPFPAWAYEVLFVSKRLGVVDRNRTVARPHPLDAPNNAAVPDCQR